MPNPKSEEFVYCGARNTPRRIWKSSMLSKKRFQVAVAEAFVTLALDEFEEDRT
ncbi:hypothetical protein H7F36_02450 [Variovorax sp. PAMC28562]|nr:hypothetical protein H7F36_02450 [Variovorax sp. PAMC28562]